MLPYHLCTLTLPKPDVSTQGIGMMNGDECRVNVEESKNRPGDSQSAKLLHSFAVVSGCTAEVSFDVSHVR